MDSVRKNRSVLITRWVDLCMPRFLLHASPTHSAGSFLLGIVVINYHLPPNPGFACPPWASHFLNLADWRNRWPLTEFLVYLSLASFSEPAKKLATSLLRGSVVLLASKRWNLFWMSDSCAISFFHFLSSQSMMHWLRRPGKTSYRDYARLS